MAKKLTAKQKQDKLKAARKDGKISAKEARNLRSLGISEKNITRSNTSSGKITVTGKAKENAKPPAKGPTNNKKQSGSPLKNANKNVDKNASFKGATTKPSAGVKAPSKPAPKASPKPVKPEPSAAVSNAQKNAPTTSKNISRGDNQPTPTRPGTPSPGSTGNVKSGISGQQANKILRDFKQGGQRLPSSSTTSIDPETGLETTTTTPGEINYDYYNNNRIYGKAKNALGIRDVNKLSELEEIRQYALGNQNPNAGKALSEYGIRGSGEFDDIVAALGGDAQAGYDVAEQMRKKGITMTDPRYEKTLQQLAKGVQGEGRFGSNLLNLSFGRLGNGQLDVVNKTKYKKDLANSRQLKNMYKGIDDVFAKTGLNDLLSSYSIGDNNVDPNSEVANELQGLIDQQTQTYNDDMASYQAQIDAMGMQVNALGSMADGYAATNQYLQDELNSANAYVTAADQRAKNMATAFVPNANPNASSVTAGDFRKSRRRKEDNQLSDLAVLTDVGSNSNPLAGLQLA